MKVEYIVNDSGTRLIKTFESPYLCRKFVEKVRRSKKLTLVSWPLFN